MCLLMDPGLVYGFTKPFDDYFRDHADPSARAAVTKFLTQRCEVPGPVATQLMDSPNFYHPAIFQLVGARKGGALADYESQLGAKRCLTLTLTLALTLTLTLTQAERGAAYRRRRTRRVRVRVRV